MKAKVKFDSAQLKVFLLLHVEKIVFGGFVVAFLMLCWSAFKLKPYDKTPDQLKSNADKISQNVEQATPPDKFSDLASVPNFSGDLAVAAINPDLYKIDPLNRPYEDHQELRKEPKFLALEAPMGFAGYGGIAINEEGGVVTRMATGGFGSGMDSSMGGMGGMAPEGMDNGGMMGMNAGAMMGAMSGMMSRPPGGMQNGGPMGQDMGEMMKNRMSSMAPSGMGGMGGMPGAARGSRRNRGSRDRNTARKTETKPAMPRPKPQVTERIVISQTPRGSKVEGRYWVCLVGAVPYRSQFIEYQNTFRDARGYEIKRDFPRYSVPQIERAEVLGNGLGKWESLNMKEVLGDLDKWGAEYTDVVDKKFIDPDVTEPLPPLVFANHNKDKVNHPLTKLEEEKPKAVEGPKRRKVNSLGGTAARPRSSSQLGQSRMGMNAMNSVAATGGIAGQLPEYRLFRFFDFTVEPGKTYRYRVRLMVENPNADVPRHYLEDYKYADGPTRPADWSEPSEPIAVIAGNRLLAGNVSVSRSGGEPTGKLLAKQFDSNLAVEVRKIFDVSRGSVLNDRGMEIGVPDPKSATPDRVKETVDFETNALVLDMFGGEKLAAARSAKVPGHVLVLDNDGEFKTLVQSNDSGMYETEEEEAKGQLPPKEGERKPAAAASDSSGNGGFFMDDTDPKKPKRGRR
jgi:hypothetical protein